MAWANVLESRATGQAARKREAKALATRALPWIPVSRSSREKFYKFRNDSLVFQPGSEYRGPVPSEGCPSAGHVKMFFP